MKFDVYDRAYEIQNEKRFPWSINIGTLENDFGSCTALLPTAAGGVWIHSVQNNDERLAELVEWICCNIINTLVPGAVKISVYDYSIRKVFVNLEKLSHLGIYQICCNNSELSQDQKKLKELIRERHHSYLSDSDMSMSDFNQKIDYIQSYQVVVVNLETIGKKREEIKWFSEIIDEAFTAGVFFIFMGDFPVVKDDKDHEFIKSKIISMFPALLFSIC